MKSFKMGLGVLILLIMTASQSVLAEKATIVVGEDPEQNLAVRIVEKDVAGETMVTYERCKAVKSDESLSVSDCQFRGRPEGYSMSELAQRTQELSNKAEVDKILDWAIVLVPVFIGGYVGDKIGKAMAPKFSLENAVTMADDAGGDALSGLIAGSLVEGVQTGLQTLKYRAIGLAVGSTAGAAIGGTYLVFYDQDKDADAMEVLDSEVRVDVDVLEYDGDMLDYLASVNYALMF